jgi:hypothetical protein
MSGFERRWRRLARAASRAGDPPLPPPPDGARLLRLARAVPHAAAWPWARPVPSVLALALLWAMAVPALEPAWRGVRDAGARLAMPPAIRCCGPLPQAPSPPAAPAFARPRLPSIEEAAPSLPCLPRWLGASCKEKTT